MKIDFQILTIKESKKLLTRLAIYVRKELKMSQEEIAKLIGLSRPAYSALECEKREMSAHEFLLLQELLRRKIWKKRKKAEDMFEILRKKYRNAELVSDAQSEEELFYSLPQSKLGSRKACGSYKYKRENV